MAQPNDPALARSTPYPALDAVLVALLAAQRAELGEELRAVYLQGSFATGGHDEDSDVDLLFVTATPLPDERVAALNALHARVYERPEPWARHLEGSYVDVATLRRYEPGAAPLLFLDNGATSLVRSRHCDTQVVRRVTRRRGIALFGPAPSTMIDPVSDEALRAEVRRKLLDWAEAYRAEADPMPNRWEQPYALLSFCRMLHTLATGDCHSKGEGADWAAQTLDPEWAEPIRRAWADRPNPSMKARMPSSPADVAATMAFIDYAEGLAKRGVETG